jgi:hypothetical protein
MKIRNIGCAAGSVLTIVAVSIGCQEKKAVTAPTAVSTPATPSPEESFKIVVESFREGIEDIDIGFLVPDSTGGHSRMTGSNEVSSELIPPTTDGGQYQGIITVRRESQYSLQRSTEVRPEEETAKEGQDDAVSEEGSETEILDPAIVNTPDPNRSAGSKLGNNEVMIASKENFSERKYELVYDNGRWTLTTKLDPKTERSIQNAFDRALNAQSEL